jgi:hypothetical protein
VADKRFEREAERRRVERRKQQLPFEGPDRRSGKDRRRFVRQVMSGEIPLPDDEFDASPREEPSR